MNAVEYICEETAVQEQVSKEDTFFLTLAFYPFVLGWVVTFQKPCPFSTKKYPIG